MRGFGETAERLRRSTAQVFPGGRGNGGSGVVWSADGVILTNANVARGPAAPVELWDGQRFEARVESRDSRRDLAALRIATKGLEAATPGDSPALRPGELVIAIGNPLAFAGALSTGAARCAPAHLPVSRLMKRGTSAWSTTPSPFMSATRALQFG